MNWASRRATVHRSGVHFEARSEAARRASQVRPLSNSEPLELLAPVAAARAVKPRAVEPVLDQRRRPEVLANRLSPHAPWLPTGKARSSGSQHRAEEHPVGVSWSL